MKNHMRTFQYLAICLLGLGAANVFGEMAPATGDELAELRESAATLTYLRSMNEDYAFQPRDLQTLEQMQGKGE